MGFGVQPKTDGGTPGISLDCIPSQKEMYFDCNSNRQGVHLFSHKAGSTNIPVQPLSISKKRVFESVTRSSAPASMKNPSLN